MCGDFRPPYMAITPSCFDCAINTYSKQPGFVSIVLVTPWDTPQLVIQALVFLPIYSYNIRGGGTYDNLEGGVK